MLNLHKIVESNSALMIFGILAVASIGGLVQILPTLFDPGFHEKSANLKPYTALELTGRDIYIREGCVGCHSQQVRPFYAEVMRYGEKSNAGEAVYDRPFLWGSKRTGPDLARVGGKYSDKWHALHLINPRDVVPPSIMPAYPWLAERTIDDSLIEQKLTVLKRLGHPYTEEEINQAKAQLKDKKEIDAMIAYLQSLKAR